MAGTKWCVRNVAPECREMVLEVQQATDGFVSIGELLSEAIETWYQALPADDDSEEEGFEE